MHFCILHRNSRWPPKMAGKRFSVKNASTFCRYPVGQKFRRNHYIPHYLRDKGALVSYAEIQDGHQKNSPVDSAAILRVKTFVEIALARTVSEINISLCFQR